MGLVSLLRSAWATPLRAFLFWALFGAALGYFVLSPTTRVLDEVLREDRTTPIDPLARVAEAFSPAYLLWALVHLAIGSGLGIVFGFLHSRMLAQRTELQRLNVKLTGEVFQRATLEGQLEEQLKKVEELSERRREILEAIPDAVVTMDRNGRITFLNQGAVRLTGYSVEEATGRRLDEIFPLSPPEDQTGKPEPLPLGAFEQMLRTRDGRMVPTITSHAEVRAPVGELLGRVSVFKDISALRRAEEEKERLEQQLIHSERLASLGLLAAGVAHEINAPLNNISLLTESISRKASDPSVDEKIRALGEQVEAAARIVRALLEFSRKPEAHMQLVDLNEVVRKGLTLIGEVRPTRTEVVRELSADLPAIQGDPDQLQQVLLNMVNNALDAMPNGGRLRVATQRTAGGVELVIEDTGVGIAPENLTKIFDPFFTTKQEKGTGLGLSICHGIIRAHNGTVDVRSEVGKGTTFTIHFPGVSS